MTRIARCRIDEMEADCIQSAKLDGKPLNRCWFYHRELADGGLLELKLGPEPNHKWGGAEAGLPPSESEGQ